MPSVKVDIKIIVNRKIMLSVIAWIAGYVHTRGKKDATNKLDVARNGLKIILVKFLFARFPAKIPNIRNAANTLIM